MRETCVCRGNLTVVVGCGMTERHQRVVESRLAVCHFLTRIGQRDRRQRRAEVPEGTVKTHLSAAFKALGVRNRTEAVFAAARLGLRPVQS